MSEIIEWFCQLNEFPTFFIINALSTCVECTRIKFFSTPAPYLFPLFVIMYFPMFIQLFIYPTAAKAKIKDTKYGLTILLIWFISFCLEDYFIQRMCFTYYKTYAFIYGLSIANIGINTFKRTYSYKRSMILSIILSVSVMSFQQIFLRWVAVAYQKSSRSPLPVIVFSLIVMTIYSFLFPKSTFRNEDHNIIFVMCVVFGCMMVYRSFVSDKTLLQIFFL